MNIHVVHHCQTAESVWILRTQLPDSLLNLILQGFLHDFVLLFPFHPAVLKPYFHLFLRESKRLRDFDSPWSTQIPVVVKLLFQLDELSCAVDGSVFVRIFLLRRSLNRKEE